MQHLEFELFHFGDTPVTPLSLLVFSLTLLVSYAVAIGVRRVITRLLIRGRPEQEGMAYAVGRILQYLLMIAGVMLGLENVGISITAFAALGAMVSVGIGFGLQNITQNFISGVILLVERPVQQGDVLELSNGTTGRVDEIGMRATRIVTPDGVSVLVPNSALISEQVFNLHSPAPRNRLRVGVGVAYGSDTSLVREVLLGVAREHPGVMSDPPPDVLFVSFGDSSLDFELAVWLGDAGNRLKISSDLRFAIDAAFREHAIQIPFPQRDLHVVSGLEGLGRASAQA